MSREYDLVVFDWDGTLMDSAAKIVSCMQSAARDEDIIPPGRKEIEEIIGLGLPQALEQLFPGESAVVRNSLQSQYSVHYAENDKTHTPFFPGVEEGLAELESLGYHTFCNYPLWGIGHLAAQMLDSFLLALAVQMKRLPSLIRLCCMN